MTGSNQKIKTFLFGCLEGNLDTESLEESHIPEIYLSPWQGTDKELPSSCAGASIRSNFRSRYAI